MKMEIVEGFVKGQSQCELKTRIYQEDGAFIVENESLAVYGTGNTKKEAIEDFFIHLSHFYEYYKKQDKDNLIGDAQRLKEEYEGLPDIKEFEKSILKQSQGKVSFEGKFESLKIRMGINGKNITIKDFLEVVTCQAECHTWWRFVLSEDSKELIVMKKRKKGR